MTREMIIEGIGYLGSLLVVLSMLMTSVKKLRIVNTIGSVIFTTYAFIIHSYPTAFMNICLILINLYQLYKLADKSRTFNLVKVKADNEIVHFFIEKYIKDINQFFPSFTEKDTEDCDQAYVVMFRDNPAGLFLGKDMGDGVSEIALDYAVPRFRDTSVGKYLYRELPEYGIKTLCFSKESMGHEDYMKSMGFEKNGSEFRKNLS